MTRHDLERRRFMALAAWATAGMTAVGATRATAQTAPANMPEITSIPEKLKGTGEVRIAAYGGTAQDAERMAYFKPFEKLSGIKTSDYAGADINKVKAMVETGNVQWDVVQLGRSTVKNLMKKGATTSRRSTTSWCTSPITNRCIGMITRWICWCGPR